MNKVDIALSKMLLSTDPARVADACAIRCLKLVMTQQVDTAATDGIVLLVNPEFAEQQTIEQLMGLLVHEVCHARFLHTERFEGSGWLDHHRANMSMDREINPIVRDAGYVLPDNCCWPSQIGCEERLSWEEYYQHEQAGESQPQNDPQDADDPQDGQSDQPEGESPAEGESESDKGQQGDGESDGEGDGEGDSEGDAGEQGEGEGGTGKVSSGVHAPGKLAKDFAPELLEGAEGETLEDAAKEVARKIAEQIQDATEDSKVQPKKEVTKHTAGTGTADQDLNVAELVESDCPWQETVISLVATRAKGESIADWSRPHRRSIGTGSFRPNRKRVSGLRLALVLDVSGSCVGFFSHWQAMAREMVEAVPEITELEILYHDDDVKGRELWSRRDGEELVLKAKGGGGTSFGPVLAEVESLDVDGAILFTDAEGNWPKTCSVDCITVQPPGSWQMPPYGKAVRIKEWR